MDNCQQAAGAGDGSVAQQWGRTGGHPTCSDGSDWVAMGITSSAGVGDDARGRAAADGAAGGNVRVAGGRPSTSSVAGTAPRTVAQFVSAAAGDTAVVDAYRRGGGVRVGAARGVGRAGRRRGDGSDERGRGDAGGTQADVATGPAARLCRLCSYMF
eukprot:1551567-Pleurochrysis_carterae.AAC.1